MKVTLRPLTEEDTDLMVRWRNEPEVLRYFIDRRHITRESHLAYYRDRILTGKVRQYIILCDEKPVGSTFLRDIEGDHAEFGILIGEQEYLGKGVGRLAAAEILNIAFTEMNLQTVFLRVLAENQRAIRSYRAVGFLPAENPEKDCAAGADKDIIFMCIHKGDFQA